MQYFATEYTPAYYTVVPAADMTEMNKAHNFATI